MNIDLKQLKLNLEDEEKYLKNLRARMLKNQGHFDDVYTHAIQKAKRRIITIKDVIDGVQRKSHVS